MGRIFGKPRTPNEKLMQARLERKLEAHEIAARIEIHLVTYYRWESGKQKPGLRHLRALCELLEKKPEEIGYDPDDL